jgi:hypothetical protein
MDHRVYAKCWFCLSFNKGKSGSRVLFPILGFDHIKTLYKAYIQVYRFDEYILAIIPLNFYIQGFQKRNGIFLEMFKGQYIFI